MTADAIEDINAILKEKFRAEITIISSQQHQWKADAPKLYWMTRSNMSKESTDKIRQHMGLTDFEKSERMQDPVSLWTAMKATHSARNTGNSRQDQLFARNSYNAIRMEPRETIVNLHRRLLLAAEAISTTSGG